MDPATIAGVVLAFLAIFVSMILEGGNPMAIFLIPPLLLVFVGTIGAAMAGGLLKDTIGSFKALQVALMSKVTPPDETESLRAPWTLGPVCGGRIDGWAYGVG